MKHKYTMIKRIVILLSLLLMMAAMAGCDKKENTENSEGNLQVPGISITSASVIPGGKLKTICANSAHTFPVGENKSPQLTFDKIDGAGFYVVIMYDTSADDFLHWYAFPVLQNELKEGMYSDPSIYTGPYPPDGNGTHAYRIRVYALHETPDDLPELKVGETIDPDAFTKALDLSGGKKGNILAIGNAEVNYTFGDETK